MKINIQSPHVTLNESLTKLINQKVARLSKHDDRILKAEVLIKFDKASKDDDKICEIKLITPERHLFASKKCLTFEDALTHCVKALEQQITKKKTQREGNSEKIEVEETTEEQE
jgi:putative sigma-54 modulation protein